ncbi:MAG: 16S rRNA (cytosine(1402)-N(4))-methyltransferase RsmH [Planctomycetota bacterium]|nr:MAG: 16S rRNA (cytosine(1402)-N(4))-methyltransferase RsmH [Planctomycetota bacterium]
MVSEVLKWFSPLREGWYWDLTLGLGGHSKAILEASEEDTRIIGLDRDRQALEIAKENLADYEGRIRFFYGNFHHLVKLAYENQWPKPAGILMDLGTSALQLEKPDRGFSFSLHGPLDMRMDNSDKVKAEDILNRASYKELVKIFRDYGEERFAPSIAREIIKIRKIQPLKSTTELADIVSRKVRSKRIHPATRIFQALRIAVNRELEALEEGLKNGLDLLLPGGRMIVISFHSLEDRIVKHCFRDYQKHGIGKILTKKPIMAREEEKLSNPRSRSAKMRVFEKGE